MSDSQQWTLSDLRAWSTDRLSSALSTITTGLTATYDDRWVYSHDLHYELKRRHPTNDDLAAVAHGAYFDGDWAEVSEIERDLWRNVVKAIRDRTERHSIPASPAEVWALIEAYRDAAVDTNDALKRGDKDEWRRCMSETIRLHNVIRAALGLDEEETS